MPKYRVIAELKRLVIERAGECCEYCRSQACFGLQSFSIEHIWPFDKGGKTLLENLALSCQGCNGHKHTKTHGYDPSTKSMDPLFHPRQERWNKHFSWNDDCSLMIGLTATGRATIEELKLNRDNVVNLRRVLFPLGKHPPAESS